MDRVTPIVALVSDFGRRDSYVAEMHAAIVRRVPEAHILDITHDVPPFDRVTAALAIERAVAQLPAGAALAAIVDPGVGTSRRRIFARRNGVWLIAPDNGVLPLCDPGREVWSVREGFLIPREGVTTFDGREVFAPLAALLAAGLSPALAGEPITSVVPPVLPADAVFERGADGLYASGVVVALDRYGNAVTNVKPPPGRSRDDLSIVAPVRFAGPLRRAYGDVNVGQPLALVGSSGRIELAVREGPSGLQPGQPVVVRCAC